MASSVPSEAPDSILIIGSGIFGLSTALALLKRPEYAQTRITLLEKSPFPASDGSSIDASRIVRADYADTAYARLGAEALNIWRDTALGQEGRYTQSGLALVADPPLVPTDTENTTAAVTADTSVVNDIGDKAKDYTSRSLAVITDILGLKVGRREDGADVQPLPSKQDFEGIFKPGFQIQEGSNGYVNWTSGWAHAENGVRFVREQVESRGRVHFRTAEVARLIYSENKEAVLGAELKDGENINADLTIVASGAWSPQLVDLRGVASATGQPLTYITISAAEQAQLEQNPVILRESGMFIIPPVGQELKIARHGYGYANLQTVPHPEHPQENITISVPRTQRDDANLHIPAEGAAACRAFLKATFPALGDRPFTHTRVCWYLDTESGDFIIDYHPRWKGLFLATGGSGHGYKFLPVIGERIVDVLSRVDRDELGKELRAKWAWPKRRGVEDHIWTNDWRGGPKGQMLDDELTKGDTQS